MAEHVRTSAVPTIMIYSQTREGKYHPADLERLFDPDLLYHSGLVQIQQINPVTKTKLKNICTDVCRQEQTKPPTDWEAFHTMTHGDLRHAILSLQNGTSEQQVADQPQRDESLSSFHALGKLLYAKRKPLSTKEKDSKRGRLEVDPEQVIESSGMGVDASMTFLSGNGLDFFTNVSEWSKASDRLSDAAYLNDRGFATLGSSGGMYGSQMSPQAFPQGYATSLAGRAVADANRQPAPNQFRALPAPRIYEVRRNARDNHNQMELLRKRLVLQDQLNVHTHMTCTGTFVTEMVPYIRATSPQDVEAAMNNMYSVVGSRQIGTGQQQGERRHKSESQLKMEADMECQRQVLADDDLDEFSSDDDDNDEGGGGGDDDGDDGDDDDNANINEDNNRNRNHDDDENNNHNHNGNRNAAGVTGPVRVTQSESDEHLSASSSQMTDGGVAIL